MKRPAISEDALHKAVVDYLTVALPPGAIFHHSPNESPSGKVWRAKMKAKGTRSGWPDIEVFHDGRPYFVELKGTRGRVSGAQHETMVELARQGFPVMVCWSVAEVAEFLGRYIPLRARI